MQDSQVNIRPADELRLGLAVASLVLGILSIVLSLFLLGALLGLVGLILGFIHLQSRRSYRALAGWGLGTSIAGILLSIFFGYCYYSS